MNQPTAPSSRIRPSLARNVAMVATAMLALVLAVVSTAIALVAEAKTRDRLVQITGDKVQSITDAIDSFDQTSRLLTDKAYQPFRQQFAERFDLDGAAGQLLHKGAALNGDFTAVDAFARNTGGVATIFMRKGDDFERITTSLKTRSRPARAWWARRAARLARWWPMRSGWPT